jgi:hypothetical protein
MKRIVALLLLLMLVVVAIVAQPHRERAVDQAKSAPVQGSRDNRGEDDRYGHAVTAPGERFQYSNLVTVSSAL